MVIIVIIMPIRISTITDDLKLHDVSNKTSVNEQFNQHSLAVSAISYEENSHRKHKLSNMSNNQFQLPQSIVSRLGTHVAHLFSARTIQHHAHPLQINQVKETQ